MSDLKSLGLSTVFGRVNIERRHLKELLIDSNGETVTRTKGHALMPGTWHSIVVQQEDADVVILVDDREVYRTDAKLKGTVSVYPAVRSTLAISEIVIEGEADIEPIPRYDDGAA